MSEKKKEAGEVELDFDRLARLGSKINELLCRKTKSPVEAYAVLRFLCVYYEQTLGIAFEQNFEAELLRVVKKSLEGAEKEPCNHENCDCDHEESEEST